jgi:hypothetical protein
MEMTRIAVAMATILLTGCAADRIAQPSKVIGEDIASFQGSLSTFQDDFRAGLGDQQAIIDGTEARRAAAIGATRAVQVEWDVMSATTAADVFKPLQTQGQEEVGRLLSPASSSPPAPPVSFPIDKLSATAKALGELSKGRSTRGDIEFLVNYGTEVNNKLKAIEEKAKPKAQ